MVVTVDQALGLLLASALLIVVPGPTVLFVVGRALAHGRRVAVVSAAGNALGTVMVVACLALGLGPVVQASSLAYDLIRLTGAAYLVWLGSAAVRSAAKATEERPPSDVAAVSATATWPALRAVRWSG